MKSKAYRVKKHRKSKGQFQVRGRREAHVGPELPTIAFRRNVGTTTISRIMKTSVELLERNRIGEFHEAWMKTIGADNTI